jgi:cytochrome c biogenesis protein CcmG, thiol:disulfide interchange protein DsbE
MSFSLDTYLFRQYHCSVNILFANRRWLFPLILGIAGTWIMVTAFIGPPTTQGRPAVARQGFPAPQISLNNFDGTSVSLSDYEGQVVVINFWASWCPPCRAEMPALQSAYLDLLPQGVTILAVNAANQDDPQAARSFVAERGLTFPILEDITGAVSRAYQVNALPSTYFIDHNGIIRKVIYGGPLAEALLRAEIIRLVEEMP